MHENERKIEKEPIKIGFGTLFSVFGCEGRTDVVIDVGEESWFSAANVRETKEGKKWFFHAGTGGRENIQEVTGQMSFDEVIKAAELGAEKMGIGDLPEKMRKILEESSKNSPREIE